MLNVLCNQTVSFQPHFIKSYLPKQQQCVKSYSLYWRQGHPRCSQQLVIASSWMLSLTRWYGHLRPATVECSSGTSTGALSFGPGSSLPMKISSTINQFLTTPRWHQFSQSSLVGGLRRQLSRGVPGEVIGVRSVGAWSWTCGGRSVVTAHCTSATIVPVRLFLTRKIVSPDVASSLTSQTATKFA